MILLVLNDSIKDSQCVRSDKVTINFCFQNASDEGMLYVTSSIHIASQGLLAVGRNDGSIVLLKAVDVLFRYLLNRGGGGGKDRGKTILSQSHSRTGQVWTI